LAPTGPRAQQLDLASRGGGSARLAEAWKALQCGLTPEAEGVLREANLADSGHPAMARMLSILERLDRECTDPDLESIGRALGGSFAAARGPHVLLLHQQGEAEAADRLEMLERIVRSYYLFFAAQGLELRVPEHRLVAAWFADQRDYLAFLHTEGADAFR